MFWASVQDPLQPKKQKQMVYLTVTTIALKAVDMGILFATLILIIQKVQR
jgi:hypothetical protein